MSPSIHLPTTKKTPKKVQIIQGKKKKKNLSEKIGVCLLLPPHMSVPATTKKIFSFISSMLLTCVSGYVPSSVMPPSRPVCVCLYQSVVIRTKSFSTCWRYTKYLSYASIKTGVHLFVSVCGHLDQIVFHPLKIRKVFQLRFHRDRCASVCISLWSSGPNHFPPVEDMQSISVTLPSRLVCVCFFLQIQEIIPRKKSFSFNFQHFQWVTWRGNTASWYDQTSEYKNSDYILGGTAVET